MLFEENGRGWSTAYGLKVYNPIQEQVTYRSIQNPDTIDCSYLFTRLIWDDSADVLICPTHLGDGIHRLDPKQQQWSVEKLPKASFNTKYRKYSCRDMLFSEKHGTLVLGNNRIFQKRKGGFDLFPYQIENMKGHAAYFLEDAQHRIWVSTYSGQLFRINIDGRVEDLSKQLHFHESDNAGWVNYLHKDHQNRIWIRRDNGMVIYLPEKDRFIRYSFEQDGKLLGAGHAFFTDKQGITWVTGLIEGLGMTDPENLEAGIVKIIPFYHGQFDHGVADSNGDLWLSTNKGDLVKMNRSTFALERYEKDYDFPHRAELAITPDDVLFMGRATHIGQIDLSTLEKNKEIPIPYLKGMEIMGKALDQLPTQVLKLPYDQNFLEFNISYVAYNFPDKVKLYCKLEGLDESWVDLKGRSYASYPGLAPGTYTFRSKLSIMKGWLRRKKRCCH